jgi:uncharacterized protein YqgC (DUF456 family)
VETLTYILLFFQFLIILTTLFGLPGNIISLIVPLILVFLGTISWKIFALVAFIILLGEIIEFGIGYVSGKFYGINSKSFWSSIIGATVLGILMAPLLFGIGAVIGVFLGTFLGTFLYEIYSTKNFGQSLKRSFLSLFSKLTGTIIKLGLGFSTVVICFYQI